MVILFFCSPTFSTTLQDEFVKGDVSIRQIGMGGAATGVADDLSCVFYNPAGMANAGAGGALFGNIDSNKLEFDENHYYAYNLGWLGYMGYDKKLPDGERVKTDMFSMAKRSEMGISYGVTFKNIFWDTATEEHRGYSMDAGLLLDVTPQFSLGIMGQDAIAEKQLDIAGSTRAGFAYKPFDDWVLIAGDTEIGRVGPGDFTHYGVEAKVVDGFKIRAGVDRSYTTFGASLDLPFIKVHYAGLLNNDVPGGTVQMIGGEFGFFEKPQRQLSAIRQKEFALIEVGGNIVGGVGDFSIFGGGRMGADSLIAQIKDSTKDPYIDGIILKIRGFDGGMGSFGIVQDIRSELEKSRQKGKKIVAYLEEGTLGDEYYLASVADVVVAPPAGTVGGLGKSVNIIKVQGLLEKLGIEMQVIAKGKYKTSFNMYSDKLTDDQREMIRGIVADLYRQMVNDVAANRKEKISLKKLKEIADGSVFSAGKAKELGLIDEVGYFKDAMKAGQDLFHSDQEIAVIGQQDIIREPRQDYLVMFPNKIAVIDIDGDIVTGTSGKNIIFGGHSTGADEVTAQLRKAADDWQVKAIIIRINSGGGSAVASGQIYSEVLKAKEKGKIVVASMGDVAASGGYYIAAAADKVVANPGTITGSIGVIEADILNYSGLLKMLGIKAESIKEGKHADMFSGLRRLSTAEVNSLSIYMEETYQLFIKSVADGRKMTTGEVEPLAGGKVYTGSQAKDVKLVDKLGNFTDSVNLAAELSKIPGEPELVSYREENMMFQLGSGAVKMLGLGNGIIPDGGKELAEYKLRL